jgi:hypothetical protein
MTIWQSNGFVNAIDGSMSSTVIVLERNTGETLLLRSKEVVSGAVGDADLFDGCICIAISRWCDATLGLESLDETDVSKHIA